ncbi:hypothetical protein [Saccharopolyspora griseoalba]|uniref:Uncharacterized protein n=1 Tax=Saccharopolyspora griseoalba TaxID=1431848 RepID=A0ABW2LIU4_9PSEU
MEMLFLLFLCGFAAATLIFWPLLNRANKRAGDSGAPQRGRHALDAAAAPAKPATKAATTTSTATTSTTATSSSAQPEDDPNGEETGTEQTGGESTQPVSMDAAPQPREPEEDPMPELPTDLFETRYQAKFNRPKRRLERIRAEIGQRE